ncbi:uncharacterized protein Dwil_GK22182 [Drosophila willistoni]|uniref:Dynein regulatory complex protein 10 n=1 Tax=Drosophila willistoni TaxID=7260 RepID=B4MY97_DROWI|nr:golgin subfamily A member 6-like protein 6 [Drosophila willistoni]EDW77086.1 uncharacterized protein Dwil_GK22182 [Drosophila willistoni]
MDSTASNVRLVQLESVLNLLEESAERVKMSLIMPKILENPTKLRQVLKGTKYEKILPEIDVIGRKLNSTKGDQTLTFDHNTMKVIDFFHCNYAIYKLFPELIRNLTPREQKILISFQILLDIAQQHLHRTSKSELSKERKLHAMYLKNEDIKSKIAVLKAQLTTQRVKVRWRTCAKSIYLQKIEDDLANKKWQNNVRIQNEIEKCSRSMHRNHKISLDKQKELQEELDKSRAAYQKLTNINLEEERDARAEKNKLLIQLQGLLKKYDSSMGERMRENLQLQDEFLVAKKKLDDFMVIYRHEENIYKDIVFKREEEERRQQQHRLVIFMMNRAAKTIQKYWRKWRKEQRKKNKRQKKGKKKGGN